MVDSCPPRYRLRQPVERSEHLLSSRRRPSGGQQRDQHWPQQNAILSTANFHVKHLSVDGRHPMQAVRQRGVPLATPSDAVSPSTAMKKPSVPCRAGVRSSPASLSPADSGGSFPMAACPRITPRQRCEVRMVRQKPGDLVVVLLRQHRAGDVDEPAAGLHERRRQRQESRAAPPGAGQDWPASAATWRRAGGARRRCRCRARRRRRDRSAGRAPPARLHRRPASPERCAHLPASAARRWGAGGQRHRRRRRSGRCSAWLRQTPASCRRRLHKYRAPAAGGRRPAISAAICEPSSCTSYQPLPCAASSSTLGCRPGPSGAGRRTPSGENGVGMGANRAKCLQHLLAVGLERVDPQIDRRPARQRFRFLRGSLAERSPQRGLEPIGKIPEYRGRRIGGQLPRQAGIARPRSAAPRHRPSRRPAAITAAAERPRARGAAASATARERVACPSAPQASAFGAGRRRRDCRWRRGRRNRRSDGSCPSRRALRRPADAGPVSPRAPRRRP